MPKLIRQWLKAYAREPNGVMVKLKGRGTPQGGVISPLWKSQWYYRLKFADTCYGEMTHYGLHRFAWADVRRTRN